MFIHSNNLGNNRKFLGILKYEKIVLYLLITIVDPIINVKEKNIIFHNPEICS